MGLRILLKNTLNIFKKKRLQLLAIGIIIGISSFLYTTMFYTLNSMKDPFEKFVKEYNQEDFSINIVDGITSSDIDLLNEKEKSTVNNILTYSLNDIKNKNKQLYNKILDNRIKRFEDTYKDFELELRKYKEVNFTYKGEGNKITFIKDGESINLSYIEEGDKPKSNNEIAVSKIYANKNNLNIGDSIQVNKNLYKITGYVLFPDMTLPINGSDFIIDNSKITPALVVDNEFENISSKEEIYLSGVVKKEYNKNYGSIMNKFDKKVVATFTENKDLDFITNIISTKNQIRSGAIYEEVKSGQEITIILSVIMLIIAVMIVLILIYKIIRNEKSQIGLLKSIGYSENCILIPYLIILIIVSLPMLIIGYIGGVYASSKMKDFYLDFYLIPDAPIKSNLFILATSVIIPMLIILLLSYIIIKKLLSKKVINLLKENNIEKVSKLNKISNILLKNCSAKNKFKYSFIFNNTSKFVVFFIGIFLSSMLIIMSFMMIGFFEKMTTDYYNDVDYVYEGYVDFTKGLPSLKEDEEQFISIESIKYKGNVINIKGISPDNKLHKLYDKKYKDITKDLDKGVIINKSFSKIYNIKKDDIIEIEINNQRIKRIVSNISKDYGNETIYWRLEDIEHIITYKKDLNLGINKTYFNGVYSKSNLDESNYISVINKNDIISQSKLMQKYVEIAVYIMIGFGIFIGVLVLYILTTLTTEDNYYNISLLKVMGYSKKEVNSMILNSYLLHAIISYFISTYITVVGFDYIIGYMGKEFGIVMPFEFKISHLVSGLLVIIIIFFSGTFAAKKRIDKVSLQEVLKEYRE
ncbi:ABC transporter permease [Romboutsia sp. Marseille-P6047]|uniref:ABC transporter permease n=1 Tax=Romboutsia sp. Marseille-P6047 TaxID=2161817 RepID=UPI000F0511CD|nr:ABC transporter permease [Romboutsia sp. Marseille-P6047]